MYKRMNQQIYVGNEYSVHYLMISRHTKECTITSPSFYTIELPVRHDNRTFETSYIACTIPSTTVKTVRIASLHCARVIQDVLYKLYLVMNAWFLPLDQNIN